MILEEGILCRLSVEELLICREVCPYLKKIVDAEDFAKLHYSVYKAHKFFTVESYNAGGPVQYRCLNYSLSWHKVLNEASHQETTGGMKMKDYACGLHLFEDIRAFRNFGIGQLHICNLVTNMCLRLPSISDYNVHPLVHLRSRFAIGFVPSTNECKVVAVFTNSNRTDYRAEIFSNKNRVWNLIPKPHLLEMNGIIDNLKDFPLYCEKESTSNWLMEMNGMKFVVCFQYVNEMFHKMELPEHEMQPHLLTFGGKLGLLGFSPLRTVMWVRKSKVRGYYWEVFSSFLTTTELHDYVRNPARVKVIFDEAYNEKLYILTWAEFNMRDRVKRMVCYDFVSQRMDWVREAADCKLKYAEKYKETLILHNELSGRILKPIRFIYE